MIGPRDSQTAALADAMLRLASGEYEVRVPVSAQRDDDDALAVGLDLLAETLQREREARQKAEALLHDAVAAYDQAPGMFCSVDAESLRIVKCNATLAAAVSSSKQRLHGVEILDLVAPADRDAFTAGLKCMCQGTVPPRTDFRLVTEDQSRSFPVLVSGSLADGDGPAARLRIIFRDVTEEQSLEDQLRHAQKMDAVGRLASGVAHDFNNILAVIMGAADFAAAALTDGHPALPDIDAIADAAKRAASLTQQLLAFGRTGPTKRERLDLSEFVQSSRRLLEQSLVGLVELDLRLTDDPLPVSLDPTQLTQVILNLVLNARDAMPDGGRLQVSTARIPATSDRPESAVLTVQDDGDGMSPDVLERAFEPFFTTKPQGEGAGLGLAMCFSIVRQSGGTLTLDSQVGRGTTVRIALSIDDVVEARPTHPTPAEHPRGRGETVLVAEDSADVRAMLTRALTRAGYRVLSAESGAHALAQARECVELAALVADVGMPGMSGAKLARALWQERPALAVVFVSGHPGDRLERSTLARRGVRFIGKPFAQGDLLSALGDALSESEH